jgi:hypothetical protein
MLFSIAAVLATSIAAQVDTVVALGMIERDLTGDGRPDVLRLVGVGASLDSLGVTFSIQSSGRILFETQLSPMMRTVGYGAGRRELSASQQRARLAEFADWFFADVKFMRPDDFVERLRDTAPGHVPQIPDVIDRDRSYQFVLDSLLATGHSPADAERMVRPLLGRRRTPYDAARGARTWEEIRSTGVTVFEFSPGGDIVTAIAWSERDRRFYRLLECC